MVIAFITGKSEFMMPSRIIEPNPGMLKKLSSSSDPRIKKGTCAIRDVMIGMLAFFKTCFNRITLLESPFAFAVLT